MLFDFRSFLLLLFLFQATLLWHHASGYFLVYDDYALVVSAQHTDLVDFFRKSHIGFYRPLPFVWLKLGYLFWAWSPSGYVAMALLIHTLNALLVGIFACLVLRVDYDSSPNLGMVAGVLFFLSPWACESYFWVSSVFDRLLTLGVLCGLIGTVSAVRSKSHWGWIILSQAGCILATGSKESGVILPVIAFLCALMIPSPNKLCRSPRLWLLVSGQVIIVLCYLLVRAYVISGLSGAYGDFLDLLQRARPLELLHPLIRPPLAKGLRPLALPFSIGVATVWLYVLWKDWRKTLLLLSAFLVTLFPVIGFAVAPFQAGGTRFLYLPSVFSTLLLARGLQPIRPLGRRRFLAMTMIWLLLLPAVLASVTGQSHLWREACRISRNCMEQFSAYRNRGRSFFITNLPGGFLEGPYMLKPYAFSYFPAGKEDEDSRYYRIRTLTHFFQFEEGVAHSAVEREEIFYGWWHDAEVEEEEVVITFKY